MTQNPARLWTTAKPRPADPRANRGSGAESRVVDDVQITVAVVSAHPMYRRGIVAALREHDIETVRSVADGNELSATDRFDVVLIELGLPGVQTVLSYAGSRTIIVLPTNRPQAVQEAVRVQCAGLLRRDVAAEELRAAVLAVAGGTGWISPILATSVIALAAADGADNQPAAHRQLASITRREREVLVQVAAGHSNRRIAAELFISENTVKNHVRSILEKLDLRSRVEATRYAVAVGLVDPAGISSHGVAGGRAQVDPRRDR